MPTPKSMPRRSKWINQITPTILQTLQYTPLPSGKHNHHIISQETINPMVINVFSGTTDDCYVPRCIMSSETSPRGHIHDLKHLCSPVAHPTTDETIKKYKKLANDLGMWELWTTVFCNEFEQGHKKLEHKNTIFVM